MCYGPWRRALFKSGDLSGLQTVKNVDLIRLITYELEKMGIDCDFVHDNQHLKDVLRSASDIVRDARASVLAGEPVDMNVVIHAGLGILPS
jgi:uncharacterized radical SAM superfamily protein